MSNNCPINLSNYVANNHKFIDYQKWNKANTTYYAPIYLHIFIWISKYLYELVSLFCNEIFLLPSWSCLNRFHFLLKYRLYCSKTEELGSYPYLTFQILRSTRVSFIRKGIKSAQGTKQKISAVYCVIYQITLLVIAAKLDER